jgi:hypothetical protein
MPIPDLLLFQGSFKPQGSSKEESLLDGADSIRKIGYAVDILRRWWRRMKCLTSLQTLFVIKLSRLRIDDYPQFLRTAGSRKKEGKEESPEELPAQISRHSYPLPSESKYEGTIFVLSP